MIKQKHKTAEDIQTEVKDSFQEMLNEIEVSMKALKMSGRDYEEARVARTRKILRVWFNNNGWSISF